MLLQIREALKDHLQIENVLGGLAADTDDAMPEGMRRQIEGYWRQIESELGTEFNYDFWRKADITPRRATYPACRAVIAAARQGAEQRMIEAVQQAYYLRALNPSDEATLVQLARELKLDAERFLNDMQSLQVQHSLEQQVAFSRSLPIRGFPSWVLRLKGRYYPVPVDYRCADTTLSAISARLADRQQ